MPEQECPLCKQVSKYIGVDFGRKKFFECSKCKDFVITLSAEEFVVGLKPEVREHFSKQSSALKSHSVLFIWIAEPIQASDSSTRELKSEEQPKDRWI
jgi:hypothetical protein